MEFIEKLHLVGDFYGSKCELRDWQRNIICRLFGTIGDDGDPCVRRCLLMLPRKCSKTYLSAAICLYALLCRGQSQQVLSAAASQKQAHRVFDTMCSIIRQDPFLKQICDIIPSQSRIVCEQTYSYFAAISSSGNTAHGYEPTVVVADELHGWTQPKHRELFSALTTGRGTRKAPLTILISTQTANRNSIAGEEFSYAQKIKGRIENGRYTTRGTITNPEYLAVLYYSTFEDDWESEELWHRVCPALGDFIDLKEYREKYRLAKEIPSQERAFRQLYLNQPIDEQRRWMEMDKWDACAAEIDIDALKGCECVASLDLAPVHDLSALTLLFEIDGKLVALPYFWCNEDDILHRSKVEKVPYDAWHRQGHIRATPGSSTDFDCIRSDINQLAKDFRITSVVADQKHAYQLGQQLISDGLDVMWHGQSYTDMSPPMNRLEKLVIDRTLQHPGNPVLDYCMSNVIAEQNFAGEIRPSNKLKKREEKIDGAVSLIQAVGVWMSGNEPEEESVYASRGVLVI